MSTSPLLLESRLETDRRDETISDLRDQLRRLDDALRQERNKSGAIEHALREMRHLTKPFYQLLRVIHGELDEAGIDGTVSVVSANPKWDAIKARNPGRIAQAIDVLLIHGTMNNSQLAAAMKMNRSNCSNNVVTKLRSMGLIIKNGSELSLRPL